MQIKFPKDVKDSMKDCLLSISWKKSDIIDFFKNNSCTVKDLKSVNSTTELSRAKIISNVFESLNNRTDGGLRQYRSMLESLTKWSYFDPYYFHKLKKLDLSDAKLKIAHLKQLQEIRDGKIKSEKRKREVREKNITKISDPVRIRNIYFNLLKGKDENGKVIGNQKRGYLFEDFLKELFAQENLIKTSEFSFNVEGEQIDGTIKFEGENYIIEAKWHDVQIASNHLSISPIK